jgi:8-oxo-dGTP pyrophosphatase MutT (NUDIX family)
MELNHQEVTTPARAAATVMLLRPSTSGPEVYLLRRHASSDVLAGAYVFPGGKLDADDHDEPMLARLDRSPEHLHALLADPQLDPARAAGHFVAACRETFEECGILLTDQADADTVERASSQSREGFQFVEVLQTLNLRLATQALLPWSRWITPRVPSVQQKRFDTRFFMAVAPTDQVARHDPRETSGGEWMRPRDALKRYWARDIELAPPQIMSLAHLARFPDVESILTEAQRRPPPVIQPEPIAVDGGRIVAYPGDVAHPLRDRAMPGPLRLVWRKDRFEPEQGFNALFS